MNKHGEDEKNAKMAIFMKKLFSLKINLIWQERLECKKKIIFAGWANLSIRRPQCAS